ncbi:uncharacterized protein LOC133203615 [Saccostrea echinata]|uniref:uncharacterized protein LOC133203615 n=1 Tax=Saccostrea echinata TaxID=191078 RepID=UPI002A8052D0|nr:uncharacterized protein LOC133203615 [Saccostrea echinata]
MAAFNSDGFSDNFDGSEFDAHRKAKILTEKNEKSEGFDNPCLDIDDGTDSSPATLPVTQDDIHIDTSLQSNGHATSNTSSLTMTSLPVLYTTETGGSKVVEEQVIIGGSNGKTIQTQQTCCQNVPERWRDIERQKPLTQTRIKVLKILSIVALFLFFPLGIPAVIFAFRLQSTLNEGIMQGNIDKAISLAKRVERLIIFAGLFALLTGILVFALVERAHMSDEELKANLRNRILPG